MQLVAYGAQDIYLTGNPMITYFKVVYRRHTNFAMESIEQTFTGNVGFGNKVTALISRNGDLVSGLTLEVVLPSITSGAGAGNHVRWINDIGHHLIEECSIEIGGQQIDKHYGDWLEIWAQLTVPASKKQGYREMIGQDPRNQDTGYATGLQKSASTFQEEAEPIEINTVNAGSRINSSGQRVLYVPLQFWFCRNVGLALPLIALQYHEVKVSIKFLAESSCYEYHFSGPELVAPIIGSQFNAKLWADYIYLDTDERRRFAQVSHEYLVEQLQVNEKLITTATAATTSHTCDLTFNHPVKELIWVTRDVNATNVVSKRQWSNYTTVQSSVPNRHDLDDLHARPGAPDALTAKNPTESAILKLNGHDRFSRRNGDYFNLEQTSKHHTSVPDSPGINVYSFALKPEDHQPSGACNFSRIDNAQLMVTIRATSSTSSILKIFAVNYNVLRIMSGMGGLAYSN